jgi:aspartate/methionine/tyrosine aminotransferase
VALGALPDYPWDAMRPYAETARRHPDGIVDLSIGSPVDPTPTIVRDALTAATDAHSYPQTAGTPQLRRAISDWFSRRRNVSGLADDEVLPTIGSKELVAWLPLMLGLGERDVVVHPRAAYPTYAVGATIAGARAVASDDPADWPDDTRLVWLNSPGNPDGAVLDVAGLARAVARCRACSTRGSRVAIARDCLPCIRSVSSRTSLAIGPRSSPATVRSSRDFLRSASTRA